MIKKILLIALFAISTMQVFSQNNALNFDGTDDYVTFPEIGTQMNSFTYEAWIKPKKIFDQQILGYPPLYLFSTDEQAEGSISIQISQENFCLEIKGSAEGMTFMNDSPIVYDVWQHVAVTCDVAAKKITYYYNGKEQDIWDLDYPPYIPPINLTSASSRSEEGKNPYAGTVDEIRIWNKVRTSAEIKSSMCTELTGTESGLVAYYQFNQGVANGENTTINTLNDKTSNHFDGTLHNFGLNATATSNWVNGFVIPKVPGTPTAVSAEAGNKQVIVNFTAPSSDGGSPINDYTVTYNPGGIKVTGRTSPVVISGLTPGQSYTFTVTANNNMGGGVPSAATAAVKPYQVPTITSFAPNNGPVGTEVTITGTGFNPNAAYNLVYFAAQKVAVSKATATSLTVTVPAGVGSTLPLSVSAGGYSATSSGCNTPYFHVTNTPTLELNYANIYQIAYLTNESCISLADFSNDGKPDIAITNPTDNRIYIGLGVTGYGFKYNSLDCGVGGRPTGIVSSDFNNDGKIDLASSLYGSVGVFLGNGNGTFSAKKEYSVVGSLPRAIAVGDLNGDGKSDLIAGNTSFPGTSIDIFIGNGDGTFKTGISRGIEGPPAAIAVGDLNRDNKDDIVVCGSSTWGGGSYVNIFYGKDILNSVIDKKIYVGTNVSSVLVCDLNRDGKLDIVFLDTGNNTLSILQGNGDGTFMPKMDIDAGSNAVSVSEGDFDGDGKPNLMVLHSNGDESVATIWGRNDDGTVTSGKTLEAYSTSQSKAIVGDFNFDGRADFFITAQGYSGADTYTNIQSPIVATHEVTGITSTSASVRGEIVSFNNALTTLQANEHGVVYSTEANPTIESKKLNLGRKNQIGSFTANIPNLTPGTKYYAKAYAGTYISAKYYISYGKEVSFTTLAAAPNAPTEVSAKAGNAKAVVSFTAPYDNGSPLTGYSVTSIPEGITTTGLASPITVSGLTNGTSYTFTVTATNLLGTSMPSVPSNAVTPMVDTEKPVINQMPENISVSVEAGKTYATVSWTEPTATDNVGVTQLTADYKSGAQFPAGTTTVTYTAIDEDQNIATASFTITVAISTGIDNPASTQAINLYPNPVKDVLNINTGNMNDKGWYNIVSISGSSLAKGVVENGKASVSMQALKSGIYIINIQTGGRQVSHTIVKK